MAYIFDFLEKEDCMAIYIDVVRQVSNIFDLGTAFLLGLIYTIKKDKSLAMGLWIKENVKQLLIFLDRHVKVFRLKKT